MRLRVNGVAKGTPFARHVRPQPSEGTGKSLRSMPMVPDGLKKET